MLLMTMWRWWQWTTSAARRAAGADVEGFAEDADAEVVECFVAVAGAEAEERGGGAGGHVAGEFEGVALGSAKDAAIGGEKGGDGVDDLQRQATKLARGEKLDLKGPVQS